MPPVNTFIDRWGSHHIGPLPSTDAFGAHRVHPQIFAVRFTTTNTEMPAETAKPTAKCSSDGTCWLFIILLGICVAIVLFFGLEKGEGEGEGEEVDEEGEGREEREWGEKGREERDK